MYKRNWGFNLLILAHVQVYPTLPMLGFWNVLAHVLANSTPLDLMFDSWVWKMKEYSRLLCITGLVLPQLCQQRDGGKPPPGDVTWEQKGLFFLLLSTTSLSADRNCLLSAQLCPDSGVCPHNYIGNTLYCGPNCQHQYCTNCQHQYCTIVHLAIQSQMEYGLLSAILYSLFIFLKAARNLRDWNWIPPLVGSERNSSPLHSCLRDWLVSVLTEHHETHNWQPGCPSPLTH